MPTYTQMLWLTFDAANEQEAKEFNRRLIDAAERGALEEISEGVTLMPESDLEAV
jgi:hypothetical protein